MVFLYCKMHFRIHALYAYKTLCAMDCWKRCLISPYSFFSTWFLGSTGVLKFFVCVFGWIRNFACRIIIFCQMYNLMISPKSQALSPNLPSEVQDNCLNTGCFSAVTGDSQRVEMPRKDMEVIMGQMVVLEAWYTPTTSIEKNAVIWTFMANHSKQVSMFGNSIIQFFAL